MGVNFAAGKLAILRPNCGSWDCPFCAKKKAAKWARRTVLLVEGEPHEREFDFVTLTLHEKLPDFAATNRVFSSAWQGLYNALKRYETAFSYIGVPELHANGRVHLHLITDFAVPDAYFIHRRKKNNTRVKRAHSDQTMDKFWKDMPRAHGWGYANDQAPLQGDTTAAAAYVGKYLGKQRGFNAWPKKFKHIRASHDVPDDDDPEPLPDDFIWLMQTDQRTLIEKISAYTREGFKLINQHSGEILT